jgi:hypothetical protein
MTVTSFFGPVIYRGSATLVCQKTSIARGGAVIVIVLPYSLTVKEKPSQVEKQMVKSLKEIIEKAVDSYWDQDLLRWILDFPGQVLALIDSPISIRPLLQKTNVKSIFNKTNYTIFRPSSVRDLLHGLRKLRLLSGK